MTIPVTNIHPPRADFRVEDFNNIIYQKGRRVWYEKALKCPCKSKSTNSSSNCKNCGGLGWVWINGKETRMVITGVSFVGETKQWSEEERGMINVTCNTSEQLTQMDKITLLDANSIHQEVVHFIRKGSVYYAWTTYPIKKLLYAGAFISVNESFQVLESADIEFGPKNLIKLVNANLVASENEDISITLRYFFASSYSIIEMKRETMQSFRYEQGAEVIQEMPLSAVARRLHLELNAPTLLGGGLLDNNYTEVSCDVVDTVNLQDCHCVNTIIIPNNLERTTIRIPFVNENEVQIVHNYGEEPDVTVYNQDGEIIDCDIQTIDTNTVIIRFNVQLSGTVIIQ